MLKLQKKRVAIATVAAVGVVLVAVVTAVAEVEMTVLKDLDLGPNIEDEEVTTIHLAGLQDVQLISNLVAETIFLVPEKAVENKLMC